MGLVVVVDDVGSSLQGYEVANLWTRGLDPFQDKSARGVAKKQDAVEGLGDDLTLELDRNLLAHFVLGQRPDLCCGAERDVSDGRQKGEKQRRNRHVRILPQTHAHVHGIRPDTFRFPLRWAIIVP